METQWLSKFHAAQGNLRWLEGKLQSLEHRLDSVGLEKLSGEVAHSAKAVSEITQLIDSGLGELASDLVTRAHEGSANMLRACLVGGALATTDPTRQKDLARIASAV